MFEVVPVDAAAICQRQHLFCSEGVDHHHMYAHVADALGARDGQEVAPYNPELDQKVVDTEERPSATG